MTVLEAMNKCKSEGVTECWVKEVNGYEFLYGLYGRSSIANKEYIESNKEVLFRNVLEIINISPKITRIIYV